MNVFKDCVRMGLLIASALLLLTAILFLNAEGTTWGNSGGFLGFVVLFPAAFAVARFSKSRWAKLSSAIVGSSALMGMGFTIYTLVEAKRKAESLGDGPVSFYPPEVTYQLVALIVCGGLIYRASRSWGTRPASA